ncbi:gallinacin-13-like [Columba livia]|uniref:Gallinacin-13-like n=1 Tax=Columba livia TaxID=8932 RepID=A0A2I0LVY0_COLLI|nr:gallinacin-13-like [Columba livia]
MFPKQEAFRTASSAEATTATAGDFASTWSDGKGAAATAACAAVDETGHAGMDPSTPRGPAQRSCNHSCT